MTDIAIVGYGTVGKAVHAWFPKATPYDVRVDSGCRHVNELLGESRRPPTPSFVFVCVPTYVDGVGIREVRSFLQGLRMSRDVSPPVIIKSTLMPGDTDELQAESSATPLLYNPEFLDAGTAVDDFAHPDKQILGTTEVSHPYAVRVMAMLPRAPFERVMDATEAEIVKASINAFYATTVVYANGVYDLCEKTDSRYEMVREAIESDRRIAKGHWDVWHGGYRGFGGACLPKDLRALIERRGMLGMHSGILKTVEKENLLLQALERERA